MLRGQPYADIAHELSCQHLVRNQRRPLTKSYYYRYCTPPQTVPPEGPEHSPKDRQHRQSEEKVPVDPIFSNVFL